MDHPPEKAGRRAVPLRIQVTPYALEDPFAEAGARALEAAPVREALGRGRRRLISVLPLDADPEEKPRRAPRKADRFRATVYDYGRHRTLLLDGRLRDPANVEVTETATPPRPTPEEFREAARALRQHPELGRALAAGGGRVFEPMPPMVLEPRPDGTFERLVTVGVGADDLPGRREIAAVHPGAAGEVVRFEGGAPPVSRAGDGPCGPPSAGQATASGVAGSVWITVKQGGTTLWKFLAVRPAASSGTNGSGVELRYVDYRGKRVLYRAHVPILNVKYDNNACGPYRDWQNQEGMIQATGTQVAPGFLLANAPATTILDTGSDAGSFLGVAIYVQGQEVVLVSEMQAGWYRYVSEWRLHANGTIRPRFGFSAVQSFCVCNVHHHHVYWRLDFDLRTPGNNRVREFNDPPLVGNSNWHTKSFEIRRPRDPARKRRWRVENTVTGEAYDIIPGADDGVATQMPDWPYGRGDLWFLRYHASEIDDGSVATGPPYEAGIDQWVNGEDISNHDVVVWYGGHFTHDIAHEEPGHFGHIVGPTLKLVKW